jgi:cytochrome P450
MNLPQTSSLRTRLSGELPPTPPLPSLIQTLACRWMPLTFFEWCRNRLGDRFTLYPLDMAPAVFLSRPDDIRAVLSAPPSVLHPGAGGAALRPIVGDNSFMLCDGQEHMLGRKAILPVFSARAIETHISMVSETASREVATWPIGLPFAVYPRVRSMSLRIILRTVFQDERADLRPLHDRMLSLLNVNTSFVLVEPRLRHLPGWRRIWRRFTKDRELVDREIHRLITRRRSAPPIDDVLGRLLAAGNADGSAMSDAQLRDNLVSVILAGHETTASEITWALQLLAHHPEVQTRLAEEIATDESESYMAATIEEVLRHRPVFLFAIPRVVAEPVVIGGWRYRPPAQLLACTYLLQHDTATFPDPDTFRPERFLTAVPPTASYLPWGGGHKRCPGHRLATLEMRALVRAVLAAHTVSPSARRMEPPRWRSVIVTPHDGGRVVLHSRLRAHHAGWSVSR